jgi:hypothetical protein
MCLLLRCRRSPKVQSRTLPKGRRSGYVMTSVWGPSLRLKVLFQGWRLLAVFAGFWFAELVLQGVCLMLAGERFASSLLLLPATLVAFFALSAGAAFARGRLETRLPVSPSAEPPARRPDVVEIRAALADLGQQRLNGMVDEEEFRARRDHILQLVTNPVRG